MSSRYTEWFTLAETPLALKRLSFTASNDVSCGPATFMDCAFCLSYHQGSACRPLEEEVVL